MPVLFLSLFLSFSLSLSLSLRTPRGCFHVSFLARVGLYWLFFSLFLTPLSFCSTESNLAMMVESMKTGAVNGVPVIFVLDEFERFTCRKPQTLLYALLDLCQVCLAVSVFVVRSGACAAVALVPQHQCPIQAEDGSISVYAVAPDLSIASCGLCSHALLYQEMYSYLYEVDRMCCGCVVGPGFVLTSPVPPPRHDFLFSFGFTLPCGSSTWKYEDRLVLFPYVFANRCLFFCALCASGLRAPCIAGEMTPALPWYQQEPRLRYNSRAMFSLLSHIVDSRCRSDISRYQTALWFLG